MTQTAPPRPVLASRVPSGGTDVAGFYLTHFMGAVFPLSAGIALYGWHAAVAVAMVVGSAAVAVTVWRRIGPRGRMINYPHALWLALVLAMILPAQLAAMPLGGQSLWPILPLAGLVLVIFLWMMGGLGSGHIHPVVATYLLLVICFGHALVPHQILNRSHLFTGELLNSGPTDDRNLQNEPWIARHVSPTDADYREPAAERLTHYTTGRDIPFRQWEPLQSLLRDKMPPLEDFIVAGQPGVIGGSSVVAVIIGGLFLLYRGVIDYRIPLLTCAAAYLALLLFPIPQAILSSGPQWRWAAFRLPSITWSVGITFVNYEMMASPLIFTSFFLATSAAIRPMTRRGRTLYAIGLGVGSAAAQLYFSVLYGPYLALLVMSLLTPELDRWFRAKPLI